MMMKMLSGGGMEILTDQERAADEDNPKGYFELERVKKLKEGDQEWVRDAQGKVIKVISALLEYLPEQHDYKVIFMRRELAEILASQKQMLVRRGEPTDKVSDEKLTELYQKHLNNIETWLLQQPRFTTLFVSYNDILVNPQANITRINQFLGNQLNTPQMLRIVDPDLYRQRHG